MTGKKCQNFWQSVTTVTEPVRNNFIKEQVIVKSSDFLSRSNRELSSTPYNSTGKHFVLNRLSTTSVLWQRHNVQLCKTIALNALKNWHLLWSYEHLNVLPLNTYTPRYRHWETHYSNPPWAKLRRAHSVLLRARMRMHTDLRICIRITSNNQHTSTVSQIHAKIT